ncbi:MAG TPA: alpha/beta hydrolase [Chloroflexia bacterium]|jgi:pimeloyl-ACP methyl ester carboxylesterase|nr:alpha/beta hydrolase [Chloroflexia bacterium]
MATHLEEHYIPTNGITLHVMAAGPADGPLVVLLHGFPEFWYGWRRQIPALAAAGYRVLVPDQRGYNRSDKPRGLSAYRSNHMAADIVGLLDAVGRERAAIAGHDWGALVGWLLALEYPERVARLAILNVPHPKVLEDNLRHNMRQRVRSLYAAFFQLPGLPEWLLRAGNWRALAETMRRSACPGSFTTADLRRYRAAWARPGAITAMLNWYRAALRRPPHRPADPRVYVPVLMIWGARDQALGREMAPESIALCDDGRLHVLEDATHWVQHDAADRVNALLLDFLAAEKRTGTTAA